MALEIKPVRTRKDKRLFIDLEWQLNGNLPNWVSPLRVERAKVLNTKKNPFFQHSEIEMFIAYKDGRPSGRIAAILNESYNSFQNDNSGFWGFFECINDQETADSLFNAAADWLKSRNSLSDPSCAANENIPSPELDGEDFIQNETVMAELDKSSKSVTTTRSSVSLKSRAAPAGQRPANCGWLTSSMVIVNVSSMNIAGKPSSVERTRIE